MERFVLAMALAIVAPSILGGCKPSEATEKVREDHQRQEEDRKALGGEFRKSSGKSY